MCLCFVQNVKMLSFASTRIDLRRAGVNDGIHVRQTWKFQYNAMI
jgi:hypothetical protein